MTRDPQHSPWLCHICDATSTTESQTCSVCYKVACSAHLRKISIFNKESGIYEIRPVCVMCGFAEELS